MVFVTEESIKPKYVPLLDLQIHTMVIRKLNLKRNHSGRDDHGCFNYLGCKICQKLKLPHSPKTVRSKKTETRESERHQEILEP